MALYYVDEAEIYKCKQHPSKRHRTGVCPTCLKLRLSVLCSDCANIRPCSCTTTTSSSASTSSSSISTLIDTENPFQRSRSAAFSFLRRSSTVRFAGKYQDDKERDRKSVWSVFWFKKPTEKEMMLRSKSVSTAKEMMSRSKSVSTENGIGKGKGWYFPSPMKVFKYSKAVKFFQQRSPLHRG